MNSSLTAHSKGIQDDDVALAKLLQEQERALFLFGRSGSTVDDAAEPLTDEELARRLQEEEDEAAYQQAIALAGAESQGLLAEAHSGEAEPTQSSGEEEQEPDQSDMPLSYEDMLALGDLAGKVSKGLRQDLVDRLPVQPVCSLRGTDAAASLDRCCICQLEFEDAEEATPLPCRHCYHSECVRQWLQQSKACPVCSKEVEGSD